MPVYQHVCSVNTVSELTGAACRESVPETCLWLGLLSTVLITQSSHEGLEQIQRNLTGCLLLEERSIRTPPLLSSTEYNVKDCWLPILLPQLTPLHHHPPLTLPLLSPSPSPQAHSEGGTSGQLPPWHTESERRALQLLTLLHHSACGRTKTGLRWIGVLVPLHRAARALILTTRTGKHWNPPDRTEEPR